MTSKEIADRMNEENSREKPVTTRSVEHMRAEARRLLRATTSAQLVVEALRLEEIKL